MANEITPREKQEVSGGEQVRPGRCYVPDVDITENAEGLRLYADMPGVEPGSVHVELYDDVLTIRGDVNLTSYEGLKPIYSEYRVGPFQRRFTLADPHRYDADHVEAKFVDGVLDVFVPRAEKAKPRRIEIATA